MGGGHSTFNEFFSLLELPLDMNRGKVPIHVQISIKVLPVMSILVYIEIYTYFNCCFFICVNLTFLYRQEKSEKAGGVHLPTEQKGKAIPVLKKGEKSRLQGRLQLRA